MIMDKVLLGFLDAFAQRLFEAQDLWEPDLAIWRVAESLKPPAQRNHSETLLTPTLKRT